MSFLETAGSGFSIMLYGIILFFLIVLIVMIILYVLAHQKITQYEKSINNFKQQLTLEKEERVKTIEDMKIIKERLSSCQNENKECQGDLKMQKNALEMCSNKTVPIQLTSGDLTSSSLQNKKYPLSNVIDRNVNTDTYTKNTGNQWMLITLKKTIPIRKIVIETSKQESVKGRMASVIIEVLDEAKKVNFTTTIKTETPTFNLTLNSDVKGKYIKLTQPEKISLSLAEITIYSTPEGANTYLEY